MQRSRWRAGAGTAGTLAVGLVLVACGSGSGGGSGSAAPVERSATQSTVSVTSPPPAAVPPSAGIVDRTPRRLGEVGAAFDRPSWLGTRVLPVGPEGYGEIRPTPPELVDRRLVTVDTLPPPPGADFTATVVPVPPEVVARSTWAPACPVGLDDLRYLQVTFWGFDERPHTGELLVHVDVADDAVTVFGRLHEARFPLEEMRITRGDELDAPPTGDGNNTGAFVCRPSRGTTSWSEHAYGRAIDINPFHNPYVKGSSTGDLVVLPELASAYRDRTHERPGMVLAGDVVVDAFAEAGWGWGGTWQSSKDPMHFSTTGR